MWSRVSGTASAPSSPGTCTPSGVRYAVSRSEAMKSMPFSCARSIRTVSGSRPCSTIAAISIPHAYHIGGIVVCAEVGGHLEVAVGVAVGGVAAEHAPHLGRVEQPVAPRHHEDERVHRGPRHVVHGPPRVRESHGRLVDEEVVVARVVGVERAGPAARGRHPTSPCGNALWGHAEGSTTRCWSGR